MKKIYFLALASAILFACNQSAQKPAGEDHASHEEAVVDTQLSLNNGIKWKADSITNHNVVYLKTIADNFRIKPFPSVNDYQLLGTDLNNGVNKMIQECKMTGPDHDALHKWLEPVIKETNQLKTVTDTSVAKNTFISIDKRIDAYHNFFE
jgi:hypothetical protein